MRRPFRYFRAEFNGEYLYNLVICPNYIMQDIVNELVYHALVQWKMAGDVTRAEIPIADDDILGIAKVAGIFYTRIRGSDNIGSLIFTQSHVVNNRERSERGLMDVNAERMRFVREEYDDYVDDITEDATGTLRASFVPENTTPIGYVPFGVPLYTPDGEVLWNNLMDKPPADGTPYTSFYGERFLVHEEIFVRSTFLTVTLIKALLECLQHVNYNGPTIAAFMDVTKLLGMGSIYNIDITPQSNFYIVYYQIRDDLNIDDVVGRLSTWLYLCSQAFKLFVLIERME